MSLIPFTNHGRSPVFKSGVMIPPGETRMIQSATRCPRPEAAPAPREPTDPLAELLGQSVKSLTAQLGEFEDSLLDALVEREEAQPSPRRTLLDAIRNELLRRDIARDGG